VGVFAEVEAFFQRHNRCGDLTGGVEPLTPDGYSLRISCTCGAALERWITAEIAEDDLLRSRLLAFPN
jgi:hypothetical protein